MLFYHYCSVSAFCSILEQKRLRLSLLSMSNDAKEGQHVLDVARRLLPDHFENKEAALEQLQTVISQVSALGFCVSRDGDLLSQWRGYADDARGVAIGFDYELLKTTAKSESNEDLIIHFTPVAYEDEQLEEVMKPDLARIVEHYKSGQMVRKFPSLLFPMTDEEMEAEQSRYKEAVSALFWKLLRISNYAYGVKSPFFNEEKEWRLIALLTTNEHGLNLPNAKFSSDAGKLKPFREFPLTGFASALIQEIILGPRNQTPPDVVKLFLRSTGFGHVTVRSSTGSYT